MSELGNGFFWMKGLVKSLDVYENNRNKYPTLESYMPVLVDFYNGVDTKSESTFNIKK